MSAEEVDVRQNHVKEAADSRDRGLSPRWREGSSEIKMLAMTGFKSACNSTWLAVSHLMDFLWPWSL